MSKKCCIFAGEYMFIMATKLIKACKELKIDMSAVIEFAEANGFHISKDPNTRINDDLYLLLKQEFRIPNNHLKTTAENPRHVTNSSNVTNENSSMNSSTLTSDIIEGIVMSMSKRDVTINIGYGQDGIVSRFDFQYNPELKIGDKVEVLVEETGNEDGVLLLSHTKARKIRGWERIIEAYENSEILTGCIKYIVKGGLRVDVLGIEVFLPRRHAALNFSQKLDKYIGETIDLKVIKVDPQLKQAVVSHRVVLENVETNTFDQKKGMKIFKASEYFSLSQDDIQQIFNRHNMLYNAMFVDGILDINYHLTDIQYDLLKEYAEPKVWRSTPYDDVLLTEDEPSEYIGCVIFYDFQEKHSGLLTSSALSSNKQKEQYTYAIIPESCESKIPEADDFVTFIPSLNDYHAANVKLISPNNIPWGCVLRNVNEYQSITYTKKNQTRQINIIDSIIKKYGTKGLWEFLLKATSRLDDTRQQDFISAYFNIEPIRKDILDKIDRRKFDADVSKLWLQKIAEHFTQNNQLDNLYQILAKQGTSLSSSATTILLNSEYINQHIRQFNWNKLETLGAMSGGKEHIIGIFKKYLIEVSTQSDLHITNCLNSDCPYIKPFSQSFDEELPTEFYLTYAVLTSDVSYLDEGWTDAIYWNASQWEKIVPWLERCSEQFVLKLVHMVFEQFNEPLQDPDYLGLVNSLSNDLLYNIIQHVTDETLRLQFLREIPTDRATCLADIAGNAGERFIKDLWLKAQNQLATKCLVFDIECTDPEQYAINESAWCAGQITDIRALGASEDDTQFLIDKLQKAPIIVGHNIKEYDLPILQKHNLNLSDNNFIWDTRQIEMLLEPTRNSYALKTKHNAKDDTELTAKLFWNQLYRLLANREIYRECKEFFPKQIEQLLDTLDKPHFQKIFHKSAFIDTIFFRDYQSLPASLIEQLPIVELSNLQDILLVAPQSLWDKLSRIRPLRFLSQDCDYALLCEDLIRSHSALEIPDFELYRTTLLQYVRKMPTPSIHNLPYILQKKLGANFLLECTQYQQDRIMCVEVSDLEREHIKTQEWEQVYLIGCELESRTNQKKLDVNYTASELFSLNSIIPMRMAAISIADINEEEIDDLALPRLPYAKNFWLKRNGFSYEAYCNFDHAAIVEDFCSHYQHEQVHIIDWLSSTKQQSTRPIGLVQSNKKSKFDNLSKRLASTTTNRAAYWCYQMKLVDLLSEKSTLPVVVITTDKNKEALEQYAETLGYIVPSTESIVERRLEILSSTIGRKMMAISIKEFQRISSLRMDASFNFVWDDLEIDSLQIMWRGLMPFRDARTFLNAKQDDLKLDAHGYNYSPKMCIESVWPLMEYYNGLIGELGDSSRLYIIDSHFEDYNDLVRILGCEHVVVEPWASETKYKKDLDSARNIFGGATLETNNDYDVDSAIETIRQIFLGEHQWRDIQKEILPPILKREGNYMVAMPTGGGKSVLFQGPALYNSAFTNRLSIVVAPLKALLEDQLSGLRDKGFISNVEVLSSDKTAAEISQIYRRISGGDIALLYITPERFRSKGFENALSNRIALDGGLEYIIFDEAHCISQWGQEFRPEYLHAIEKISKWKKDAKLDACVTLFSATFTKQVEYGILQYLDDIQTLGNKIESYNPIREHIDIEFVSSETTEKERSSDIVNLIKGWSFDPSKSKMIIFGRTRTSVEETAEDLQRSLAISSEPELNSLAGHIAFYHAGMSKARREEVYEDFKAEDKIQILCATKAFGMGMDIPNIHYVIHIAPPSVLEDYLQEVGRVGRNEKMYRDAGFSVTRPLPARCLYNAENFKNLKKLIHESALCIDNLNALYKTIFDYIAQFRSNAKAINEPTSIPYNIWQKDQSQIQDEHTNLVLGMYWLQRMKRIRMGYYTLASLDLVDLNMDISATDNVLNLRNYLWRKNKRKDIVKVEVSSTCRDLHCNASTIYQTIIDGVKQKAWKMQHTTRYSFNIYRTGEVEYIYKNKGDYFTLDTIFQIVEALLSRFKVGCASEITMKMLRDVAKEIIIPKYGIEGKITNFDKKDEYMPWHESQTSDRSVGFTRRQSFIADLFNHRVEKALNIISGLQEVKYSSVYRNRQHISTITIESSNWKGYLRSMLQDCKLLFRKLYESTPKELNWANWINELGLSNKGFNYFSTLLQILQLLGYISYESLLPLGVEVYLTDNCNDIMADTNKPDNPDIDNVKEFNSLATMRNIRLCMMQTFAALSKEEYDDAIRRYFACTNIEDFMKLLDYYNNLLDQRNQNTDGAERMTALRGEALEKEESNLNEEQRLIYNLSSEENINILAGPGAGKTHILTLRCAQLVIKNHVNPKNILVLAYNRAVVTELKNRLEKLFNKLGFGRSMNSLHIHTFHAMAKNYCGKLLENKEMNEWENIFYQYIQNNSVDFTSKIRNIQYILVDEFQDITQVRLETLMYFKKLWPRARFFTIGDKNQSIYGYEKVKQLPDEPLASEPEFYYNQLEEQLHPTQMTMCTNHRSYPDILTLAAQYLPEGEKVPEPWDKLKEEAKSITNYALELPVEKHDWLAQFPDYVRLAQKRNYKTLALFFRSGAELYKAYGEVSNMKLSNKIDNVRLRVQGAGSQLYKSREMNAVLMHLDENPKKKIIEFGEKSTINIFEGMIHNAIKTRHNWDAFYFDLVHILIRYYIDTKDYDVKSATYEDLATFIREMADRDEGQLYKIYDKYSGGDGMPNLHLDKSDNLNIIFTTIHKVKGLEFDAVIIPPSEREFPYRSNLEEDNANTNDFSALLHEERRLYYVAYTRAKKLLCAYIGIRELAIKQGEVYQPLLDDNTYINFEPTIGKLYLSFTASLGDNPAAFINYKKVTDTIRNIVKRNDLVYLRKNGSNWEICLSDTNEMIGRLRNIDGLDGISKDKKTVLNQLPGLTKIHGFYICDILTYTFKECQEYDVKHNTSFSQKWCNSAKKDGFIYLVDIAGYGKIDRK